MKAEIYYEYLNKVGYLGEGKGYLRAGYSKEESDVIDYFKNILIEHGFICKFDSVGNFSAEIPGESGKYFEIASHVDTVPNGGNFDGLAGVVAGCIALINLKNEKLKHGLRLRIWRLEESATYGAVYTGSLSAFGKLNPKLLENKFQGKKLEDAIKDAGYNPEIIKKGEPTIDQNEIDNILAHVELHIEQGTVLEKTNNRIGIVTSIRGNQRYIFSLKGAFDHSGNTPMGVEFRRDCNLALAYMITELDKLRNIYPNMMQTFGMINSNEDYSKKFGINQNGLTKVSGSAFFSIDIRSSITNELVEYSKLVIEKITEIANNFNIELNIIDLGMSKPVEKISEDLQLKLKQICINENLPFLLLPSGAGHDCINVAKQIRSDGTPVPVSMIFIPCKDGISHDPKEFAYYQDIDLGTSIIEKLFLMLNN